MNTKVCNKCMIEKELNQFVFRKDKNTYLNTCRECFNKIRREKYSENKDAINAKRRARKETDPIKKLKKQVINAINNSYRRKGFKRNKPIEEILEHSIDEEIVKLLNMYRMTYNKEYDGTEKVQVDHMIPLWPARSIEQIDECNKCLQLLTVKDNRRKSGKIANGIGKNGKIKYTYDFDYELFY